MQTTPTVTSV